MCIRDRINTLPSGEARDGAVTQLISSQGQKDPATAFTWAASISTDTTRFNELNTVVAQWAAKDPAATTTAIQSASLSDQQRASLLKSVQKVSEP